MVLICLICKWEFANSEPGFYLAGKFVISPNYMLGYFKDRNTLCLKYLGLDPMLDKPGLAAIYLAQPGNVLLFFEKNPSFIFWRNSI